MPSRFKLFDSLAWRLTAWYALSSFIMVALTAITLYYALTSSFILEIDDYLMDTVERLTIMLKSSDHVPNDKVIDQFMGELPKRIYSRTYARLIDKNGKVIKQSEGIDTILPQEMFPPKVKLYSETPGKDLLAKQVEVIYRSYTVGIDNTDGIVLQIACDRLREEEILKRYKVYLWLVLSSAFIVCSIGSLLIAKRGLKPVSKISKAAGQIGYETLHERIETKGQPGELRQLALAFNAMLDRLEDSFTRISQFSEDIAHELRTPVNNLRGGMEVVLGKARSPDEYRDAIGSALEECERLARLVDRLLFIARSENSEAKIEREQVNVNDELSQTREFYEATAEESGVMLNLKCDDDPSIEANRDLLRSLLGNLVSNAIAHTPHGGAVALAARKSEHGVVIEVSDTGKGIPAEHLPNIFNRFYRVDPSRTKTSGGVGLGLSIVNTIAKLHGAKLEARSELGKGTTIRVEFPENNNRQA